GAEVLQHDFGLGHERGEDVFPLRTAHVQAHALLAPVVDREVHALATNHRWVAARLLATDLLDLDDLGAQIGQQHAPARPGLEARQLQHPDVVETGVHLVALTFTPAASSWSIHGAVESLSPQPRSIASIMTCSPSAAIGMGTSYSRASSVASPTSLRAS